MPRTFKDIADVAEFRSQRLRLPELNLLSPDAQLYEILAIQPGGVIRYSDEFLGHAAHGLAISKFNHFLRLAIEKNCDLVLSPEYSLPWASLHTAIANDSLPGEGKLWILGCEAITPDELRTFKAAANNIIWIHEPIPNTAGKFLNAVCYLFKAKSKAGIEKNVALLQFKTQAMVDAKLAWERDRLIVGKTMYFLHTPDDHIRLVTLICADALEFDPYANNQSRMALHPHVIFHPQLCDDPRHPAIRNYRTTLFMAEPSKATEVIVLNWAHQFKIGNLTSPYGGSTIYSKTDRFNRADDVLDANHKLGLYYANWEEQRTHMCLLNYDEHIFHIRAQKVATVGKAALANRSGPRIAALFYWDNQDNAWIESQKAEDGFEALCDSYEQNRMDWCVGNQHTSVDRERLLTLSAGKLEPSVNWHEIQSLGSFTAEQDERTKRLTFVQDQAADSVGFRNEHITRYITLQKTIIPDKTHYPPNIQDLKDDCELSPPSAANQFRFNLKSKSGARQGATGIFLDQQPPAEVEKLKGKFVAEWGRENTRRLVLWYRHGDTIRYSHPPLATISDDGEHPASIVRS
jgi:predicted amidohydrolase